MCATNHFALPAKSSNPGLSMFTFPIVATDSKDDRTQYERTKVINQRGLDGEWNRRNTLFEISVELGGSSYQQ